MTVATEWMSPTWLHRPSLADAARYLPYCLSAVCAFLPLSQPLLLPLSQLLLLPLISHPPTPPPCLEPPLASHLHCPCPSPSQVNPACCHLSCRYGYWLAGWLAVCVHCTVHCSSLRFLVSSLPCRCSGRWMTLGTRGQCSPSTAAQANIRCIPLPTHAVLEPRMATGC